MIKEYLGEFEELVLTMVAALQDDAYGAAIAAEIEEKLKIFAKKVNIPVEELDLLWWSEEEGTIFK